MVAAAAASRNPTNPRKIGSPSPAREDLQNPYRLPLIPSEKDNAGGAVRRPRTTEISSRYLSSFSSPSASSNSSSYSATTTFSSSISRRFPSPFPSTRPSTPPALRQSGSQKRSCSADRARPSTPAGRSVPTEAEPSAAAASTLCTTTRSLSVSFQGESFFYQTSRAKAVSPSTPTPERRRPAAIGSAAARTGEHLENTRPFENHHRWPASRAQPSNPMMRSLSCSSEKKEPILATVRLLHQSMLFDSSRRASFDGGDLSASSDTDSVSSGSNSGTPEFSVLSRAKVTPRGISVPARYRQETNSRLSQYPEPCSPLPSPDSRPGAPRWGGMKKLSDSPLSSPSSISSPLRGPTRPSSPSKLAASRGMSSPLRARTNVAMCTSPITRVGNAPSIISFATEVRRAKKGENRIEEAHLLRLLDNRHLQWRCVNARANAVLLLQKLTIEKNIYDAWTTTSELRDSITTKRIKLQLLTQNLKLASILKEQLAINVAHYGGSQQELFCSLFIIGKQVSCPIWKNGHSSTESIQAYCQEQLKH
ncbi:QWRF motif-containing protein 2-like isoform X2 [Zingiber officinale]|uniref:QWRF motif-containing protein 2-like isoform X2 n=1 Tax=Zingiber officinale TaxID=94328 RepID=UPI001C4ABA90|nr:QWRF motif-containing protein 2-like isoform X2 [Zingiber officinale]